MQVKDLNLPLKHNQLTVAKFIGQIREEDCYWCKDLLAAENNEGRQEVLKLEVKWSHFVIESYKILITSCCRK